MRGFENSKKAWAVFVLFSLVLFGVEASYLLTPETTPRGVAAWAWIACSGLVLGWALVLVLIPFFSPGFWKSRDVGWFVAASVIPVGLVLFEINGWHYTQVNNEAPQEVQSGYFFLTKYRDLGMYYLGFLGYPVRQYLLAAMPSYLWGKSLVTLRMGFGQLYVLGYLSFLHAVWRYLDSRKAARPMLMASLVGTLVSLASYPLLYARIFEQTIEPLSVTFLFLAGLLLLLSRTGPLPGLWLAWALGVLPHSYTPAEAAWGFGMVALGWLLMRRSTPNRLAIAVAFTYGSAAFATSVAVLIHERVLKDKLTFGGFDNLVVQDWVHRMAGGFHATFGLEESLIPAPLTLGIILILIHSLSRRDYRVLWVCLWAAASVGMSLALKGYCWRAPEFDIHRAMFILPVLSLALGLYVSEHWGHLFAGSEGRLVGAGVMAVILVMVLSSIYLPFIRRAPRAYEPALTTDDEEAVMLILRRAGPDVRTVYLKPPLNCDVDDSLSYYFPEAKILRADPPEGEHLRGNFVLSYLSKDPETRIQDDLVWHRNRRPFIRIDPE